MRTVLNTSDWARNVYTNELAEVSEELFGGIFINQFEASAAAFSTSVSELNLTLIRWPGGTLAEGSQVTNDGKVILGPLAGVPQAYDLNYAELFHPLALTESPSGISRASFSDALGLAIDQNAAFSMTIPTKRYLDNPDRAYTEVMTFLTKLYVNDAYNDGHVPEEVIFDIGNENYDPFAYAEVSNEILRAFRDFRALHPEYEFKVALQAMQTDSDTKLLIDNLAILSHTTDNPNSLAQVDAVRMHALNHALSRVATIEENGNTFWSIQRLSEAIERAKASAGLTPDADGTDLYFSAWTVDSDDVSADLTSGLPSAGAMLSLFTGFSQLGADYAAVWGIASQRASSTSFTNLNGSSPTQLTVSPSAALFTLMADWLPGTKLIQSPGNDGGRNAAYNTFVFRNDSQLIIFIAANDLPNTGTFAEIELLGLSDFKIVEGYSITASGGLGGNAMVQNKDIGVTNSVLQLQLKTDYEVVAIVLEGTFSAPIPEVSVGLDPSRISGVKGVDFFLGTEASESLNGNAKNNTLLGFAGDDTISGGIGNDTVDSGDGSDTINADAGDDVIFGGAGSDRIFGGVGQDNAYGGRGIDIVFGGDGLDQLSGDNGADRVFGGNGSDKLSGGEGDDALHGGFGADLITGEAGDDKIYGGWENSDGLDSLDADASNDVLYGGPGADSVFGGAGDDSVVGETGNDLLFGGRGNDRLIGGDGRDSLFGDIGNDTLFGNSGDDVLRGGDGDDVVNGGEGIDWLFGGAGRDMFNFSSEKGIADRIFDFENSLDKISLQGINGTDDPRNFASLEFTAATQGGIAGTLIQFGDYSIFVDGVRTAQFDPTDFVF